MSSSILGSVVVVGKPGAGKTSLIHALTGLNRDLAPTVGPEVFALSRGGEIAHVWDTPGQERYASVSAEVLAQASLVLDCSCDGAFAPVPEGVAFLKVRTKDDLNMPWFPADLATSSVSGAGVRALYDAIFELLAGPPAVAGGCCCSGVSLVATHSTSKTEQYRLDLLART